MEQSPPLELQKLFKMYETVIRPRMEIKYQKTGIQNIISDDSNSSKKDVRPSGNTTDANHK
jgi:hypothetical protein